MSFDEIATRTAYPGMLVLPQDRVEQLLLQNVLETGRSIGLRDSMEGLNLDSAVRPANVLSPVLDQHEVSRGLVDLREKHELAIS